MAREITQEEYLREKNKKEVSINEFRKIVKEAGYREEMENDMIHEVLKNDKDKDIIIGRLLDDKFFNESPWKYNIIRR
jgi:hypothetical protein